MTATRTSFSSSNPTLNELNSGKSVNDTRFASPQEDIESVSSIMTDKEASVQVTKWIKANYVEEREHNVPRRNMFEHYKLFCTNNAIAPVNSATFGKLLRAVFPDLKTRRLGVRGQSKYHYCGIRVRNPNDQSLTSKQQNFEHNILPNNPIANDELLLFSIPVMPSIRLTNEMDQSAVISFTKLYENHCREILYLVSTNQIDKVKPAMISFYRDMPITYMMMIHNIPEITDAIWRWDCMLYDTMIFKFLPVINHYLSDETHLALRVYTRELRKYIETSLTNNYPNQLIQKKIDVGRIFSAKLRRQLALNDAAQAASNILNNADNLKYMQQDWCHFDIDSILDQTLWVCDCDTNEIRQLLYHDVCELLKSSNPIEYWMNWVKDIVNKYLKHLKPTSHNDALYLLSISKQFLLKWNFYTTLIMKGLTLREARSFALFHRLRLFLDDYILYLVEENIAQINYTIIYHQNTSPSLKDDISSMYSKTSSSVNTSTSSPIQNVNTGITLPAIDTLHHFRNDA